jgi:hypothetical protein
VKPHSHQARRDFQTIGSREGDFFRLRAEDCANYDKAPLEKADA